MEVVVWTSERQQETYLEDQEMGLEEREKLQRKRSQGGLWKNERRMWQIKMGEGGERM